MSDLISLWFDGWEEVSIDLKPCPFCGGEPYLHQQGNYACKKYKIKAGCHSCRFEMINASIGRTTFQQLIVFTHEQWNNRVE